MMQNCLQSQARKSNFELIQASKGSQWLWCHLKSTNCLFLNVYQTDFEENPLYYWFLGIEGNSCDLTAICQWFTPWPSSIQSWGFFVVVFCTCNPKATEWCLGLFQNSDLVAKTSSCLVLKPATTESASVFQLFEFCLPWTPSTAGSPTFDSQQWRLSSHCLALRDARPLDS